MWKITASGIAVCLAGMLMAFDIGLVEAAFYYNFKVTVLPISPTTVDSVSVTVSFDTASISDMVLFSPLLQDGNQFFVAVDIYLPEIRLGMIGYAEETYQLGELPENSYSFNVDVRVWYMPTGWLWDSASFHSTFDVAAFSYDIIVPDDYFTIQEAINEASEVSTIFVRNGTYYEHVVVNKTVSLVGESRESTIIDGNGTFVTILHVTVNDVTIKGFTIQNDTPIHCLEGGGVFITNSSGTRVIDNIVKDTQYGINLKNSMNSIVAGNTLTKNDVGIQFLDNSSNNIVYHNNFLDNDLSTNNILSGPNIWDNGCEGNYWRNYNGTDTSTPQDGVGDTYLPCEGVDIYPLMHPYWNPTDINHDLKVDIKDLATTALAYGSKPGNPKWNPHADITGPEYLVPDDKVDIRDIALIAVNYGETH